MKVNLLYKKPEGTVLFLEAKKDFVDLLMSFLVLPVGSLIKLLRAGNTVNSFMETGAARLFESIEKMDQSSMEVSKSVLTNPPPDASAFRGGKILAIKGSQSTTSPVYYKCGHPSCYNVRAGNASFQCHHCRSVELTMLPNEENSTETAGYVKENVIFMITDELEVYPTSTIKSIVLLNKLKVKAMADLESIEVSVGAQEALSLLKASLVSKTVLNDVFKSYVSKRSYYQF
ncbi:hypothetical protein SELMODRAFT_426809 [Selaginella moellendorffii]|uniref:Uncharacterized protein n=1 Tax=Selaginella moellendorffii TaxID=88036 RepID=D8SXK0_SELML|nr:uncharacterized protein LOC9656758 [Selaginella moellendorffii]EFJ10900.1 hypothetical protein SELMODRAFT_426809 [Selaginella moellendorffii]|eukprot:XP_002988108.1 uncharacterized protein LOC9656758 [Selaginella moellendorffii]